MPRLLSALFLLISTVGLSYFSGLSYLGVIILLIGVLFFGGLATEGEYMPGQTDNPDGKELHPFRLLGSLAALFIIFIFIGYLFPDLYAYGASGN